MHRRCESIRKRLAINVTALLHNTLPGDPDFGKRGGIGGENQRVELMFAGQAEQTRRPRIEHQQVGARAGAQAPGAEAGR